MRFAAWDAFEDALPSEVQKEGGYDMVHVRLFGINMQKPDAAMKMVENLWRLLSKLLTIYISEYWPGVTRLRGLCILNRDRLTMLYAQSQVAGFNGRKCRVRIMRL
jgi:hypothetical protein